MVWHCTASACSIPFSTLTVSAWSLGRDAHWLAAFSGWVCFGLVEVSWGCLTRVPGRPNIHVSRLILTFLGLRRPSPQTQTLSRGVGFIVWCLRRSSLGACRWDWSHFWNYQACVGYNPTFEHTLKILVYHTYPVGGTYDKYPKTRQAFVFEERGIYSPSNKLLKEESASIPLKKAADVEPN